MFGMESWQLAVVGIVAVACVGWMSFVVARMFARRAEAPAALRESTAFESARVGAVAPEGAHAYDAFSYRVPGRFAGRVRIVVDGELVSIAGPRIPSGLYRFWIWLQALLTAIVPAVVVGAIVQLDWQWLLAAAGIFVAGQLISMVGAGIWPGMGETVYIDHGRFEAVEFPLARIEAVKVGAGWADGGMDVVLLPLRKAIDGLAKDRAVSFFAPDDQGREVRYALHMTSEADAAELGALLR